MDKFYNELTISLDKELVDIVADYIANIYDDGLEYGDDKIILRSESDLAFIKESLDDLDSRIEIKYKFEKKENIDWIENYQNSITPIEADKFYIYPSWYEPKEDLINIKIDPALAFGSGHHATTFSCLGAISKYVKADDKIIDVGCGSGILGLACVKIGAISDLCDTDPLSVDSTKENFALNSESYNNLWEGSINKTDGKYDVVIANIIADVLRFISVDLKSACRDNGLIILSGILDKKEDLVRESFKDLELKERVLKDEWVTLVYQK